MRTQLSPKQLTVDGSAEASGRSGVTRVLVVDDSPTMRRLITAELDEDPQIQVVAQAADALSARDAVVAHRPDVITLDVEMPGMDGLEFLRRLMSRRPTPVVMVSSLTAQGSEKAIEAMSIGAVDCVGKPSMLELDDAFAQLRQKVKTAANARIEALSRPEVLPPKTGELRHSTDFEPNDRVIFIGSSTGGVDAIAKLLSSFPPNCPPTVIVQHMPRGFTQNFAKRLMRITAPDVFEAKDGDILRPGLVMIAAGGEQHLEITGRSRLVCSYRDADPVSDHRPSVDVLFRSVARLGSRAIGVILTGMGHDGAEGLLEMRNSGAATIGQNSQTSVVYGMPKIAAEMQAVEQEMALDRIGSRLLELCSEG